MPRFDCPSCSQPLLSPDNQIGQAATCPYCSAKFTVPSFSQLETGESTLTSTPGPAVTKVDTKEAWMAAGIGISFMLVVVVLLLPFKGSYISDLFLERKWVPYALLLLMGWCIGILVLKYRRLRVERRALLTDGLPASIGDTVNRNNVGDFIENLNGLPERLANTIMITRLRRGLEHFRARGSNPEVASMLNMQSEIDAAANAASHTMVKVFLWAIPIMGFIGTVMGISESVTSLAGGMSGAESMEGMKESIKAVTSGLGIAFDTTLVALVMSIILSFPASAIQKAEEDLLNQVDGYCLENLLKRLDDGGTSGGGGSLPELSGDQQDLLKQIMTLQQEMANTHGQQVELVRQTTEAINSQTEALERQVTAVAGEIERAGTESLSNAGKKIEHSFSLLSEGISNLNHVLKDLNGKTVQVKKKGLFG